MRVRVARPPVLMCWGNGRAFVVSAAHLPGERSAGDLEPVPGRLTGDSFAGKISALWAPKKAVTPAGRLQLFVKFPKQSDLSDQLVREAPLTYARPNAPILGDALVTRALSMVAGTARIRKRWATMRATTRCRGCSGCPVTIRCVGRWHSTPPSKGSLPMR